SFSSRCSAATADLLSFPTRRSSDLKRGLVQCVVAEVGQAKTQVVGHKVQAGRRHQKGGQQPAHHPGKGAAHLPHKNRRHVASSSDRKSTRLNSSHVSISYAVFCLKK